jgi:hypothetical protein
MEAYSVSHLSPERHHTFAMCCVLLGSRALVGVRKHMDMALHDIPSSLLPSKRTTPVSVACCPGGSSKTYEEQPTCPSYSNLTSHRLGRQSWVKKITTHSHAQCPGTAVSFGGKKCTRLFKLSVDTEVFCCFTTKLENNQRN